MPSEFDFQGLWQRQPVEVVRLSVEELQQRALRFQKRIRWRNAREYAGAAIALPLLIAQALHNHGWYFASTLCLMAGLVYVVVQLWRLGAREAPADGGTRGWLHYHRCELERQRDALRTVWKWYLMPFVPGFAVLMVAVSLSGRFLWAMTFGLFSAFIGVSVWRLNAWAANRLDKKIEELNSIEVGDE